MPVTSHPAAAVLEIRPGASDETVDVQLRLACGCTFEGAVPADRVLHTDEGLPRVVGKYRCPVGHLPKRR